MELYDQLLQTKLFQDVAKGDVNLSEVLAILDNPQEIEQMLDEVKSGNFVNLFRLFKVIIVLIIVVVIIIVKRD